MSKNWRFWVGMSGGDYWKNRALFEGWAKLWNRKKNSSLSAKRYDEAREQARSWYKKNLHLKPGPAADRILAELDLYPRPAKTTLITWIKDLAPPELAGKGRPLKNK